MNVQIHAFDASIGGAFRTSLTYVDSSAPGKSTAHTDTYHGYFTELIPDERVVEVIEFESDDPAMQGAMTITFALEDTPRGTSLVASHDDLPPGISPADNELGWQLSLAKLTGLLEG